VRVWSLLADGPVVEHKTMMTPHDPMTAPMVFQRIGWMNRYQGQTTSNYITGGGERNIVESSCLLSFVLNRTSGSSVTLTSATGT
jgi:hypothetical protein